MEFEVLLPRVALALGIGLLTDRGVGERFGAQVQLPARLFRRGEFDSRRAGV